jgi:hypothetical protein
MRTYLLDFVCRLVFQKYKCKRKVSEVEFVSILTSEDGVPSNIFGLLDLRILSLWTQPYRGLLVFLPKWKGIKFKKQYFFIYVWNRMDKFWKPNSPNLQSSFSFPMSVHPFACNHKKYRVRLDMLAFQETVSDSFGFFLVYFIPVITLWATQIKFPSDIRDGFWWSVCCCSNPALCMTVR